MKTEGMNCIVFLEQSLHRNCHFRRKKILVKEFGIKLEGDRKERLTNMCNLGEGIWEQGIEQGKISGIIETCMKLNMSENDIIEKIKEIMHISGEEAKRYYKQAM